MVEAQTALNKNTYGLKDENLHNSIRQVIAAENSLGSPTPNKYFGTDPISGTFDWVEIDSNSGVLNIPIEWGTDPEPGFPSSFHSITPIADKIIPAFKKGVPIILSYDNQERSITNLNYIIGAAGIVLSVYQTEPSGTVTIDVAWPHQATHQQVTFGSTSTGYIRYVPEI